VSDEPPGIATGAQFQRRRIEADAGQANQERRQNPAHAPHACRRGIRCGRHTRAPHSDIIARYGGADCAAAHLIAERICK